MTGDVDEATKTANLIREALRVIGQPSRYAVRDPIMEVNNAMHNLPLLRCYWKSVQEQCGIAAGQYIYKDLTEHGHDVEGIEKFVVKWRFDLRKEVLVAMQHMPGLMGRDGLPYDAVACMILAYTATDEKQARELAGLIIDRSITAPEQLVETWETLREHPDALASGAL